MDDYRDTQSRAVKDFLAEAEEILEQLNTDLAALGDTVDKEECNPETINSIFRSAHSLKGLSGMFGYGAVADLAHNLENLLDCLRLGKVPLDRSTLSLLFDSFELLGVSVRAVESGGQVKDDHILDRINACIAGARKESPALSPKELGVSEKILRALTEYEEHRLRENMAQGKNLYLLQTSYSLNTFDRELSDLIDLLKVNGEVISTLPSADGNLESSIAFDIIFGTGKKPGEFAFIEGLSGVSVSPLVGTPRGEEGFSGERPVHTLEPRIDEPKGDVGTPAPSSRNVSRSMRVDIARLDELMNIVGELILSHGTISAITDRMREEGFSALAVELGKASKGMERRLNELRKRVMEVRMIPVGQLFERMSRIIRKISREQGKVIDLKLSGTDTELDKMIVEDVADPLMHIISNAVDHGIEPPVERRARGKDESGVIRLSSYQKGNHVVIEIEDDGRGVDLEKVRRKAFEQGLIESIGVLSRKETLELLFLPGFSTADKVSGTSGRGVGMDVVKNNISSISGTVDIESSSGVGTLVTITLPITLAIIKALLVESSGRSYAIPITSVRETISLEDTEIRTVERKEVMQLRESTLPLLRLESFFKIAGGAPANAGAYAVVVGEMEKRVGLVVDELHGQQDIVIKSIGDIFKDVKGVSGAADLGDQRTILILDVGGIVSEAIRGGV
jgi:two-component system, chemotaxis family, sensor kinase CheA